MRLIDIEDMTLLKTVSCGGLSAKKLWKRIKEQPTIDAVEVVRCKDCKYRWLIDFPVCCESTDEWFCADGERKGGDAE